MRIIGPRDPGRSARSVRAFRGCEHGAQTAEVGNCSAGAESACSSASASACGVAASCSNSGTTGSSSTRFGSVMKRRRYTAARLWPWPRRARTARWSELRAARLRAPRFPMQPPPRRPRPALRAQNVRALPARRAQAQQLFERRVGGRINGGQHGVDLRPAFAQQREGVEQTRRMARISPVRLPGKSATTPPPAAPAAARARAIVETSGWPT